MIKRKIVKFITSLAIASSVFAMGISVYAGSNSKTVNSMNSYSYAYNATNVTATFVPGQTKITGTGDYYSYYKEAYYTAYGYNSGVGYYAIYDSDKVKKGTTGTISTTYYSYTSEIRRAGQRAVLRNDTTSSSAIKVDESYLITATN